MTHESLQRLFAAWWFSLINKPALGGFFASSFGLGSFCPFGSTFSVLGFGSLSFGASLKRNKKNFKLHKTTFRTESLNSDTLPWTSPLRPWWRWSWRVAPRCQTRFPFSERCEPNVSVSPRRPRGTSALCSSVWPEMKPPCGSPRLSAPLSPWWLWTDEPRPSARPAHLQKTRTVSRLQTVAAFTRRLFSHLVFFLLPSPLRAF